MWKILNSNKIESNDMNNFVNISFRIIYGFIWFSQTKYNNNNKKSDYNQWF